MAIRLITQRTRTWREHGHSGDANNEFSKAVTFEAQIAIQRFQGFQTALAVTALAVAVCFLPHQSFAVSAGEQTYLFFAEGEPRCEIVLPERPQPEEQDAALLLRDIFAAVGDVAVLVVTNPPTATTRLRIHVGESPYTLSATEEVRPEPFDLDGLIVYPVDADNLVLLGCRPLSSFYAVTEFLEEYVGVLWVWPGETGTVIPKTRRLKATVQTRISQPTFLGRRFSGLEPARMRLWRIHQDERSHREIRGQHSHNANRVMPWNLWDTHPEYFSYIDSERRKPSRHKTQPCTSNPDVVALFAEAARSQFVRYPWIQSFSTSQNDGVGFCECEQCRALDVPDKSGLSDRWFTFVNGVAAAVEAEYPDRLIANLAYSQTKFPPVRTSLHPNVLVAIVLPSLGEERDALVEAWSRVANHLGVYFWLHGKPVPKFYPHRFAEYLGFLRKHKVSEVYAEVYQANEKLHATWEIDGPRIWLLSKLLWNPEADIDSLMERFLTRFYGRAAAPMRRYYQICEAAWGRRADPFDFGLPYRDYELDLYTAADVEAILACFEEARAAAITAPEARSRIEAQRRVWTPILGYYSFVDVGEHLTALPLKDVATAEALVQDVARRAVRAEALTEGNPFAFMPAGSEAAVDAHFAAIGKLLADGAEAFWTEQAVRHPLLSPFIAPQLAALRGDLKNLVRNPGFEQEDSDENLPSEGDWDRATLGWGRWIRANSRGQITIAHSTAHTGDRSLRIAGGGAGCGIHNLAVKSRERYRVSCWAMSPDRSPENPASVIQMTITWKTPEGRWLPQHLREVVPLPSETPNGAWRQLACTVTVPPQAGRLLIQLGVDNQGTEESAYFDDVTLELLAPAP